MAKIMFKENRVSAAKEYLLKNYYRQEQEGKNAKSKKVKIVDSLDMEVEFVDGTEVEIPKKDLDILIAAGRVRSKDEIKKQSKLMNSHRPLYKMNNQERILLLTNIAYEA